MSSGSSESTAEKLELEVDEIYEEDEVSLHRIQTRNTIISVLQDRVNQTLHDAQSNREYKDLAETEDGLPTKNDGVEFQDIDPELVTWDGDDDPQNPKNWSMRRKWISMGVVSMYNFLAPFASTMPSPAIRTISQDFNVTSTIESSMIVSVYLLAWAIFSPLIAPLSEMYGRKKVLDISAWLLFFFNLGCAFSQNVSQLIILRFFAGVGGCAPVCIGLGVLSDLFQTHELETANTLFALGPVFGPCLSAMFSGIIVDHLNWRWTFYVLSILNGVCSVVGVLLLEETYAPTLLNKKAAERRKITGNVNFHSIYEITTGETVFEYFYLNLRRPVEMLFTNPMVFGLGIFMAITYGCLYIMITTFPAVWRNYYNMSSTQVGLMYISLLIGYLLATLLNKKIAGFLKKRLLKRNGGVSTPEHQLVLLIQAGILIPVAIFWYGWGAEKKMMFIFPAVGTGLFGFSMILVFFAISLYLIEMNPRFSASSLAAVSIFRSFLGFAFPLFAPELFKKTGYGWGCSIFGFLGLLTGIPFPILLMYYGERMRGWANRRIEIQQAKRDKKYLDRLKARENEKEKVIVSV